MYAQILDNDCIPLTEIPDDQQEAFARDYLLRDRFVDIDLMQCADHASDLPYLSAGVRQFFNRTNLVRAALSIQAAYAADHTITTRLMELAKQNNISYRTLMRERSRFMSHTSLMNLLSDPNKGEDAVDRYRKCCFYCRDYIITRHESAGQPSDNSILRETKNNPVNDPGVVMASALNGRVIWSKSYIGAAFRWVYKDRGVFWIGAAVFIPIVVWFLLLVLSYHKSHSKPSSQPSKK